MDFLNYILLFLLSTVKFFFVPPLSLLTYHNNVYYSILVHIAGGISGMYFFYFLSNKLLLIWKRIKTSAGIISKKVVYYKINPKSRQIVTIKKRWGYYGLILLSPCVISIPLGAFIVARFYRGKYTMMLLLLSVVVWSIAEHAVVFYIFKAL